MRFAFTRCDTLPGLAWCAHLRRGSGVARVYHGPWVETREDWFVEGAWTGPFEEGQLDTALFLAGTGGMIRSRQAVFCTPTDMIERLYSIRDGRDLFLSNSMVFALAIVGDEPDPRYPFYAQKVHWFGTEGIQRTDKQLRTSRGRRIQLHEHCQIAIGDDLRMARSDKPAFVPPTNFQHYVSMVQGVLGAVLENAASPGRRHRRYEGLAMVSSGYDSNAVAALLSAAGVREAMTIYDGLPGVDSGENIAQILGLKVHACGRTDFRRLPGVDEAEFLWWPDRRSDIVIAACEEHLTGKVVASGRHGDVMFGLHSTLRLDDFRTPHQGGGSRMLEFRLRVGFLNFNPLYAGGLYLDAMHAITKSEDMAAWRVGGRYDRPIARRILEEAGVPRGIFGAVKRASAYYEYKTSADMSPEARDDFESYRRSMPHPSPLFRRLPKLRSAAEKAARITKRVWWSGGKTLESRIPSLFRYQGWDDLDFAMHWAHARVRPRYGEAVVARARDAAAVTQHVGSHR